MPVDTDKPAELLLFDFFTDQVTASVDGDALHGDDFELHDTIYQSITKARGVRISDVQSDMSPVADGVKEFNAAGQMVCFAKVEGKNQKERSAAMTAVYDLQKRVTGLLFGDPSLGQRVCDIKIGTMARSYDKLDGKPYAVAMIPFTINEAAGQS